MGYNVIKAENARRLIPVTLDQLLEKVDKEIRAMAERGFTELRLDSIVGSELITAYFGSGLNTNREQMIRVLAHLRDAGYQIREIWEIYEERQFVDMGITISWDS